MAVHADRGTGINTRGIAVMDMKLEVVVIPGNGWLLQEITTRLPGR